MVNQFIRSANASGTDANGAKYIVNPTAETVRVKSAYLVPNVSVATHASNYMTWDVKKGSTSIVTTKTTNSSGGAALTAGTAVAFALTGTGKDIEIAAGGTLFFEATKAGTGPAWDCDLVVVFEGTRQ